MSDYTTLPKVLLHDHLDGGLRVETIIDLAEAAGYERLPSTDPFELSAWFDQSNAGSLERYLEAFDHTVGVMQTAEALERVAYEACLDVAADGVVYAEFRFAPMQHLRRGLDPARVVDATLFGLQRGAETSGIHTGLILDAMRQHDDSVQVAELALGFMDRGVVGFDLAGPEAGYPPTLHEEACRLARASNLGLTIHAGEGDGAHAIWLALQRCYAHRIGHGVHIIDGCTVEDGELTTLTELARYVRDFRVPLEVCPTSNVHTGDWTPDSHPLGMLYRAGFTVTLNTDDRLMSHVSLSDEFDTAARHHGFELYDLGAVTRNALDAAFGPLPVRRALWRDVVAPAYGLA